MGRYAGELMSCRTVRRATCPFQDEMEATLASMRVENEEITIKSLKDSNNALLKKRRDQRKQ